MGDVLFLIHVRENICSLSLNTEELIKVIKYG
jgi:hypothetical protein